MRDRARKVKDRWLSRENVFAQRVRCHIDREKVCVDERETFTDGAIRMGSLRGKKGLCERN